MAESILLTAQRGEGKSLTASQMMSEYLSAGRIVATNMNINLEFMAPPWSDVAAYRLPDHPTAEDLESLPLGNPNPTDEERNGLLVLDETATFLNSREWQGKGRQDTIAWLAQSRKYGWDLCLIAQAPKMVDGQIREALCELHGSVKRTDKMAIPVLSFFARHFFNMKLRFPRMHVVTVRYGFGNGAPVADRRLFRGMELYKAYDTLQKISPLVGQMGMSSYLSPWILKGRYMTKIQLYRGVAIFFFVVGCVLGGLFGALYRFVGGGTGEAAKAAEVKVDERATVAGVVEEGSRLWLMLSDGRSVMSTGWHRDSGGLVYEAEGRGYRGAK